MKSPRCLLLKLLATLTVYALMVSAAAGRPVKETCDVGTINSIFDTAELVTLASRNVTLNVAKRLVNGNLPPIVFLHGVLGSLQVWRPLLTEPAMIPMLCERSVVLVDLRGFGDSQKDVSNTTFNLASNALDILAVLDHFDLDDPAIFVGHSLGGFIAQQLALSAPERTSKVAIFSIAATSAFPATAALGQVLATFDTALPPPFLEAVVDGFFLTPPPPAYRAVLLDAALKATLDAVQVTMSEPIDFVPDLPSLRVPSLLSWGTQDGIVPPEFRGQLSQLLCGSVTVTLGPSYGHYVIEEAASELSYALSSFVQSPTYVCENIPPPPPVI